jgi:hypothetical protein
LCLWATIAYGQQKDHILNKDTQVTFTKPTQPLLSLLVQFGIQEKFPIGIVLDKEASLCNKERNIKLESATLGQLMSTILSDSAYSWRLQDGVIEIIPKTMSKPATLVLQMTFDRFETIRTTIQGMGVILAGQIFSRVHPGQGYAGNILSSIDAKQMAPFELLNASTEQILNHIISTGSKGVWVLYPPTDGANTREIYAHPHTYGYKDDLNLLNHLTCTTQ